MYCGDSTEILQSIESVDATITDPPYGIGVLHGEISVKRNKNGYKASFEDTPEFLKSVCVPIIERCIKISKRVALTPGSRNMWLYPVPYETGIFYYPAGAGMSRWGFNCWQPILFYGPDTSAGTLGVSNARRSTEASDKSIDHPCPKPINDWKWLVSRASKENETVLDPFMGSGTTGVCCAKMNRKFIGIEVEPKFFDLSCQRIEAAYAQPDMLLPPVISQTQDSMQLD